MNGVVAANSGEKNEIIVYQPEGGEFHIEVRVENETVWLTQAQMAELFDVQRQAVTKHIKNKIVAFLMEHEDARVQEIATYIGLKISRTKDYLSELVDEGKIVPNGANKNRTYSLKK